MNFAGQIWVFGLGLGFSDLGSSRDVVGGWGWVVGAYPWHRAEQFSNNLKVNW